jgi:hypothetical protein
MKKRNVGKSILRLLAKDGHMTLGDIMRRLRLPVGTAAHQRITEMRKKYGEDVIVCDKQGGRWVYWMPSRKRAELRKELEAV